MNILCMHMSNLCLLRVISQTLPKKINYFLISVFLLLFYFYRSACAAADLFMLWNNHRLRLRCFDQSESNCRKRRMLWQENWFLVIVTKRSNSILSFNTDWLVCLSNDRGRHALDVYPKQACIYSHNENDYNNFNTFSM